MEKHERKMMKIIMMSLAMVLLPFCFVGAEDYYVDSVSGSDTHSGTSESAPWQTLDPVHARGFNPGDIIRFKRGSVWTGGLTLDSGKSGVAGNPVTFTTYGSGDRPVFKNPGTNLERAIKFYGADWVVMEGFSVCDTHQEGIHVGGNHNIIRDIEVTDVGTGIAVWGRHNLVTRCYCHDLNMVVNTPGGNDDYGAIGITLANTYNEASYNTLENCIAPCIETGLDGGALELIDTADHCYVHHNFAVNCDGFLEVGGGSAKNVVISYNISLNNNGHFSWINLEGKYASEVLDFRVENNTIVDTDNYQEPKYYMFGFGGTTHENTFLLKNNIVYADDFSSLLYTENNGTFTHEHNIYCIGEHASLGFNLGPGESIDDPLFVDLDNNDLHLQNGSPAIDAGMVLGYTLDFEGNPVPSGTAPDIGAYEDSVPEPGSIALLVSGAVAGLIWWRRRR